MAEYNVIIEKGEDGYLISEVLEIPGCHTQAKTIDELIERTKEAIEVCIESNEESKDINLPLKFLGIQKIEV
jgi:predicted RNase H-like HicB family nuclease